MANQWRKLSSSAYGYSLARLALNSCMLCDEETDPEFVGFSTDKETYEPLVETLVKLLKRFCEGESSAELTQEALDLREACRKQMETLIGFVDNFRTYEYVFNRMERKYLDDIPTVEDSDEEFLRRLVHYITDVEDGATMNQRIQLVIRELPVRMTRQKFYSILRESLSAYIGSDKESLDSIMYFVRSASMLEMIEEQKSQKPELAELLDQLREQNFSDMPKETYLKFQGKIAEVGSQLSDETDLFRDLQEMANDLCVVCLCKPSAVRDAVEEQHVGAILRAVCDAWEKKEEIAENVFEELEALEGVQEEYFEKYMRMDFKDDSWENEEQAALAFRVVSLISDSPFAILEKAESEGEVDRVMLDRTVDDFIAEVDPLLKSLPKPVSRAIMAGVLGVIPFCFNSTQELFEYVKNSLEGCSDWAERETSKELLEMLMEEEDYDLV
ncbi:hypothetical protein [Brotaphodocola sp.]|uniref:hypothetical protein n=1 Tax=Brotaphodocola sp. TaxID=3073577 RepID=UPI003D7E29A8